MKFEVLRTKTAELWIEDDILQCKILPNAEITIDDGKKIMEISMRLSNGKKIPVLADMGSIKSMSRESRVYLSGEEAKKTATALALVTKTPIGKIIGNFLLGLNRPSYPIKMFTSPLEAKQWLKDFIE
jgi:hypothetical protein